MVTSASTPADLVNAALIRIGRLNQIGTLYDGSEEARAAIAVYGQTRDDLIRDGDWGFAQRMVTLTLLKSAPAAYIPPTAWTQVNYPQLNFRFEYTYPSDCLKLRAVRPTPVFIPEIDPSPYPFSIANDNAYTPPRRVILTNVESAIGVYAGRVTDPTTWPPDFSEALIEKLAQRLSMPFPGPQVAAAESAEANIGAAKARMEQG